MARTSRVLSFISQWGGSHGLHSHFRTPSESETRINTINLPPSPALEPSPSERQTTERPDTGDSISSSAPAAEFHRPQTRGSSRPVSMVQTYQPPVMDVAQDTLPELLPIFTYLNSASNKIYQEGYLLKLHDLDTRGRPSGYRQWQECFAQLVGTVLSIWDASVLDTPGAEISVKPTFINISDASVKMIPTLPMNESGGRVLNNVLSVSTAGSNRYLFHFPSYASMTQWTAAIRISMYENVTLQEAYTGSLIAGKGKTLNNIRQIMERSPFKYEDWARVRFGTGTPWRKCWFVITPPDEKEFQKVAKMQKRNPYAKAPALKGTLKFYETKKITKKTRPIATITDAFSAYAIYPASKPLIEQSTLIKIEGTITSHGKTDSFTDGSIFVMPEMHAAVSGFEMLLRFLFPLYDTFALYGRPSRLIADVRDTRGLMFAMPQDRRYGYLEVLDVSTLVSDEGSSRWSEREWRARLKDLTSKRMSVLAEGGVYGDAAGNGVANSSRMSLPTNVRTGRLRFDERHTEEAPAIQSQSRPGSRLRQDRSPPKVAASAIKHKKSASDAIVFNRSNRPTDVYHTGSFHGGPVQADPFAGDAPETSSTSSRGSGDRTPERAIPPEILRLTQASPPVQPISTPPSMEHTSGQKPPGRLPHPPGRVNLDHATLDQLQDMGHNAYSQQNPSNHGSPQGRYSGPPQQWEQRQYGNAPAQQYAYAQNVHYNAYPNRLATIPASPFVDSASGVTATGAVASYFPQPQAAIPESPSSDRPPPVPRKPTAAERASQSGGHFSRNSTQIGSQQNMTLPVRSASLASVPPSQPLPAVPSQEGVRPDSNTLARPGTAYGGQLLPEDVALALKTRDLSVHGPQYVQSMEAMAVRPVAGH